MGLASLAQLLLVIEYIVIHVYYYFLPKQVSYKPNFHALMSTKYIAPDVPPSHLSPDYIVPPQFLVAVSTPDELQT